MDKIEIKVAEGTQEIILREGIAPPNPKEKQSLNLNDLTIEAPFIWAQAKQTEYNNQEAHALFNRDKMTIQFVTREQYDDGVNVEGRVGVNEELNRLGINTDQRWGGKELQRILMFARRLFSDREQNLRVVNDLGKLKLRVIQEIENSNDFQGNKKYLFEQQVEQDFLLEFKITAPILKGLKPSTFHVDIRFDVTDGDSRFWLESVELFELRQNAIDEIFKSHRQKFIELGITTIEK